MSKNELPSLAGILVPKREGVPQSDRIGGQETQTPPAVPEPRPSQAERPSPPRAPVARKVESRATPQRKRSGDIDTRKYTRTVPYSLPMTVRAQVEQAAASVGESLTLWLLKAVLEHHETLEVTPSGDPRGKLFALPQEKAEGRVPSSMRLTFEQVTVLTELADRLGTSRSGILEAAAKERLKAG